MKSLTPSFLCAAVLTILIAQTAPAFNYPNFSDTTGLTLNRDAHVYYPPSQSARCRLVSAGAIYGGGSVYYNQPQSLNSFQTSFCFRIGELGGITNSLNPDSGADGLAFLIQPFGPDFIAHTGGGQGYEGADPSLAIEFDCWDNGPEYGEPSRSHVGVMVDGNIHHGTALATANVGDLAPGGPPEIDSGIFWWANITYEAGFLTVVIGQPPFNWTELFSIPVDIPAILGQSQAYVGFTGGTGLAHANHDLCSWSFVPEPSTLAILALGLIACTRRPKLHRNHPTPKRHPEPSEGPDKTRSFAPRNLPHQ